MLGRALPGHRPFPPLSISFLLCKLGGIFTGQGTGQMRVSMISMAGVGKWW